MHDSKKDTDNYKEYLLTHGYTLHENFMNVDRYIRKAGDVYYWVTFWNGYIFLESGNSNNSFTGRQERLACTNSAVYFRFKAVPPELLIVLACQEGRKILEGLNNYCVEKTLEVLG